MVVASQCSSDGLRDANRFGDSLLGMAHLVDMAAHLKLEGIESATEYLVRTMSKQNGRELATRCDHV